MRSDLQKPIIDVIEKLEVAAMTNPDHTSSSLLELTAQSLNPRDLRALAILYAAECDNRRKIWVIGTGSKLRPFNHLVDELELRQLNGGLWDLLRPEYSGIDQERYDALVDLLTERDGVPA